MNEIWKNIKEYEGLYQVSNLGNVKSLDHYRKNRNGIYLQKGRIIKKLISKDGYNYVNLPKNNIKKRKSVHRLVAEAFILNFKKMPCVNHKDENKQNNCVNNLEWCSYSYNNNYGSKIERQKIKMINNKKKSKCVLQFDSEGNFIKEYLSIREAERQTKVKNSDISKCCNNKRKMAKGYIWKFKREE